VTIETDLPKLIPTEPAPPVVRADDIRVRWVMPEIFYDLPIHESDDDEAVRRLEELVERALPGAAEEDQARFGVICALCAGDLVDTEVEYASICLTAVDNTLCTATVLGFLVDSPEADGGVRGATKAIASALRQVEAGEVSEIELPCGFAVSCIGSRDAKLAGEMTESGESISFPTWYIRVHVPLPNGTTFILELSTPTMVGWDLFSTMFGNVVSSIRFYDFDGSSVITSEAGA